MNFRDPRIQLILLGLICQGFAWEHSIVPMIFAGFWFLCVKFYRDHQFVPQFVEALLLVASYFFFRQVFYHFGFGYNKLMFLGGNVLLVYQLLHLIQSSDKRQKRMSILVAVIHLGIGTQVIFDYKAAFILITTIVLIPEALQSVETAYYERVQSPKFIRRKFLEVLYLACMMIIFFLAFPRFSFHSRTSAQLPASQQRAGGPLDPKLEMSRSVGQGSEQLIFQIEGSNIGYLKCFALDKFDGNTWTSSHWLKKIKRSFNPYDKEKYFDRSVRVFNTKLLNNILPTDGFVQNLKLNYIARPFIAGDGGVKVGLKLPEQVTYVYWTETDGGIERLSQKELVRYLELPPQSEALSTWLEDLTENLENQQQISSKLIRFFQTNFEYKLGAPSLDRLNPIDDFIFQKREGHCERFASALCILLRMKGIPSRVSLGYLPVENNELGEFFNVRSKHAHAWAEAYYPGMGWKILDCTPMRGGGGQAGERNFALTFYEWIEYIWYSKVIEFGVYEQRIFFDLVLENIKNLLRKLMNSLPLLMSILIAVYVLWALKASNVNRIFKLGGKKNVKTRDIIREVKHFYGQMIKALAKENYIKKSNQTPLEFLSYLKEAGHPLFEEIKFVTTCFCDIRYGRIELNLGMSRRLKTTVEKIITFKKENDIR